MMRRLIAAILAITAFGVTQASALDRVYQRPQDASCKVTNVNARNAGADIVVDSTAGGVIVMDALTTRCGGALINSGTAAMRCGPSTLTVSTTVGVLIASGGSYNFGFEGQQQWKCIRTTGTSTSASVAEARP